VSKEKIMKLKVRAGWGVWRSRFRGFWLESNLTPSCQTPLSLV